jgi:Tol biopolymer transport system component
MAKKKRRLILVDKDGSVEGKVRDNKNEIEMVKWLPTIEGEHITIILKRGIPFSDRAWKDGTRTGKKVTGRLTSRALEEFPYIAQGWGRTTRPRVNPTLIVDGGRGKKK